MTNSASVVLGAQRPPHLSLPPDRKLSALSGEALELAGIAKLNLDDWQAWYVAESVATQKRSTRWAASECGLIVPRQNGKGDVLMMRQLVGLFLLEEQLAVHTAHEFKTCYEHFLRIVNVIERIHDFDREVLRIRRGAGEQAIELRSGARLRFLARSAGSGRGLSGDTVYLDEAFALTFEIMGALVPTMSARENPQLWYASSAPRATSAVLHDIRTRGREATSKRMVYAEWASEPDGDPSDPRNWAKGNPAYGLRLTQDAVQMEFESLTSEEFARERLGIPESIGNGKTVIPITLWVELGPKQGEKPYVATPRRARLALDVSADGKWASICSAETDKAGITHLEVVDRRAGTEWLTARAIELCKKHRLPISIATNGPSVAQIEPLTAAGVKVVEVGPTDLMRAAAAFVDACTNRQIRHLGNTSLLAAIRGAATKQSGDLWSWGRASSTADISPLVACSIALASKAAAPDYSVF